MYFDILTVISCVSHLVLWAVRVELLPRAFGESLTVDFDKLRALNEEDMDDIDLETVDSVCSGL